MDDYDNNYIDDGHLGSLDHVVSAHQPQNVVDEAELLAAQAAAEAAAAEQQQHPGDAFNNVGQGLTARYRDMMMQYWQETINSIEHDDHDFKNHQLPLARIKKVMKTDEDVRMISAEAPILFAKGCEVFITELTMRAWIHAEENKRRTLQKSDIAAALTKSDMFDFLIDVVPREEEKPKKSYSQTKSDTYGQQRLPQVSSSSEQAPSTNILGETGQDDVNSHQRAMLQQQLLQQQMLQQQVMGQQHPQHSPQTHQQPQQHHSTHSPRESQHLSQQHQENEGHRSSNSHQIEHHEPHSEPQSRQSAPESVQHEHLVSRNGSANGNNQNSNYEGSFQNFNSGSYGGEF